MIEKGIKAVFLALYIKILKKNLQIVCLQILQLIIHSTKLQQSQNLVAKKQQHIYCNQSSMVEFNKRPFITDLLLQGVKYCYNYKLQVAPIGTLGAGAQWGKGHRTDNAGGKQGYLSKANKRWG